MRFAKTLALTSIALLLSACGSGSSDQSKTSPVASIFTDENETTLHLYATSEQNEQGNDFNLIESFDLGYGGMNFLIGQGTVPNWQNDVPTECKDTAPLGPDKIASCVFAPLLQKMNSKYGWAKNSISVTAVFTKNDNPQLEENVAPLAKAADEDLDRTGYDAQIYYDPSLPELSDGSAPSAHYHSAYSHEAKAGSYYEDWMSRLDKNLKLNALSIPGTHDTMSRFGGDMAATQTMDLYEQLKAGIRALDIRCRHYRDACSIHHGRVYQNANLEDVLTTVTNFLNAHPNEFVIMRLKEECDEKSPCIENSRSWSDTFQVYYKRYEDHFWKPKNKDDIKPTIEAMRKKIVLLQDWTDNKNLGIPYYSGGGLDKSDDWEISTEPKPYHGKWELVSYRIENAIKTPVINDKGEDSQTFLTFISASSYFKGVLGFPYFFASGKSSHGTKDPLRLTGKTTADRGKDYCPSFPRVSCLGKWCSIAYLGMNILTSNKLESISGRNRVGIIYSDFPGSALIRNIIARNP